MAQGQVCGYHQDNRQGLLEYWKDPARERKLFFCQIEAMETVVYITEVARKYDPWNAKNALRKSL
ncbi:MAG: hypothetical protein JXL84_02940 [Deltaproteobacteria bacterium]|nr:hypothetical protein [Deltaproteobacteria bacterium]